MKKITLFLVLICTITLLFGTTTNVFAIDNQNGSQYSSDGGALYNQAVNVIENMREAYSDTEIEQTGINKETYADVIAKCLAKYSSVNNLITLEDYTTLSSSMQSYSRIIASMAVIINEGNPSKYNKYDAELFADNEEFTKLYIKHMTNALDHMIDHAGNGLDFATFELCMAFVLTVDKIPEETVSYWKSKLGEIKGTLVQGDGGWYKISQNSQDNRASYVDGAEQIRDYLGLVDAKSYIDTSLSKVAKKFSTNGMFRDSNTVTYQNSFLYDFTVRAHFSVADYFGYDGEYSDTLKNWLRKGGLSTLLLQASNGEMAYGGRSNQYLFNESLMASACEYEANYYKSIGDDYLAGVFKRSAHIAIKSINEYLDAGKHIKNMMSDHNYGIDDYGQYDKYMVSMSSFLAIGYFFADDAIIENLCPAEVGGYIAQEDEMFGTVVANCGNYSIEILTADNQEEDSIGLGRIIKNDIPSAFGLSQSFTGNAAYNTTSGVPSNIVPSKNYYSLDVAWYNSSGNMVKLSDYHDKPQNKPLETEVTFIEQSADKVVFSIKYYGNMDGVEAVVEKYTLTRGGLQVDAELINPTMNTVCFTVPMLYSNGDLECALNPEKKVEENTVSLIQDEFIYSASSDGKFFDDETKLFNRNGIYDAGHFEKEGKTISVNLKLERKTAENGKFNIKATDDKIVLSFMDYFNNNQTANVYMMEPYEYHYLDNNTGYDTSEILSVEQLHSIGTIQLDGKEQCITIDRYQDGVDLLYHKFYLADDETIYDGPMWVTEFETERTKDAFLANDQIKGTGANVFETAANNEFRIGFTKEVNAKSCKADLRMDYIWSETDLSSGSTKYSPFVASNGKTYYFKTKGGTQNVTRLDNVLESNTLNEIGTTLIVTLSNNTKLPGLIPDAFDETGKTGALSALDSSNEAGVGDIIAFFEWLGSRYGSQIEAVVLGNEIDFPNVWNYNYDFEGKGMPEVEEYVEEYYRTLRLATLAINRYVEDLPVLVPFTHYWAECGNKEGFPYNNDAEYAYAPKDILDILMQKSEKQGNFLWGIAPHPYAVSLTTSDPIGFDMDYLNLVTGEQNSPFLTFENMEVLDEYLHQNEHMLNGKVRPVYLTESGIEANDGDHSVDSDEEHQKMQAASIAYIYYKCSMLESVVRWPYLHTTDGSDIWGGFYVHGATFKEYATAEKRLSCYVWRDIDAITPIDFNTQYASYISTLKVGDGVNSYRDLISKVGDVFGSHYNWKVIWNKKYGTLSPVESIEIYNAPSKTKYTCMNKDLDLAGAELLINYQDGTNEIVSISKDMVSGYDSSKIGNQEIKIEYEGCMTSFTITREHVFLEKVIKEATNRATGLKKTYCENCAYSYIEQIPIKENRNIDFSEIGNNKEIFIDGKKYMTDDKGYITLPDENAKTAIVYSYNIPSEDVHTQYPTGMQVYRLKYVNNEYIVKRLECLDNCLQYAGASIRVTGNRGVRIITGIPIVMRSELMGKGYFGYSLEEYGTLLSFSSNSLDPVLEANGVVSNYAYKKNFADNIYKTENGLIKYTDPIVGFSNEQCNQDMSIRSYMKLKDTETGEIITIYGGVVQRSIKYIAGQNKDAFAPGTNAYNYIWGILNE